MRVNRGLILWCRSVSHKVVVPILPRYRKMGRFRETHSSVTLYQGVRRVDSRPI